MAQQTDPRILGTEPIGKLLLQYSIPAIIGMTITSLYNIIDSIFIGHGVGPMAISGLAITFPLMNLVVAFCVLISAGGSTISSIRLGQKDIKGATDVLGNTLMLCLTNAVRHSILDSFAGQGRTGYGIHLTGLLLHDLVWNLFERFIGNGGRLIVFQNSD